MKLLKTFGILLVVIAIFGSAMFGLNFLTGPIIEAHNAGAANDRLNAVMPDGVKGFEDITATLTLPSQFVSPANAKRTAKIVAVHKETSGLGYVVEVDWTSEDSHGNEPNRLLVGISTDGKIIKVNNEAYHDTDNYNIFNKNPGYAATFEGQDSTLASVGLVAGSTHSSTAFRDAVSHAFEVLILNNMITAGVKSDAQILEEMIITVAPGFGKMLKANASGNIAKAMKAENNTGFAYIMTKGDASYLAVVNALGVCKVYNVEGADVTAETEDLATEAKAHAAANQTSYATKLQDKMGRMMSGATNFTALEFNTFNTVVAAASFEVDGVTYYGFYSKSVGFEIMDVYIILDANGAIVKVDAITLFFDTEHFPVDDTVDEAQYEGSFVGKNEETFTGDNATVAGATMTSDAMKQSTKDVFATFNSINEGGEQ